MKLTHECSLVWMVQRQMCLTASDIKDLLPVTATGRPRKVTDETRLKVLARKSKLITEDDCVSTGAAARGHILEPYAVEMVNEKLEFSIGRFVHWDDIVVTRHEPDPERYPLGFSPDAMGMVPPGHPGKFSASWFDSRIDTPRVLEVKSYSPERHLAALYTKPRDLEERWQIATAMAVLPTMKRAYIAFFNPSMAEQLGVAAYDRSDLEEEIEIVEKVHSEFNDWMLAKPHARMPVYLGDLHREERIFEELELNP